MRALLSSLLLAACQASPDAGPDTSEPVPFTVVTWNTGSGGLGSAADPDGWTPERSAIGDEHYGNGLAWRPAMARATEILEELDADLVAFQEIFDPATGCQDVPAEARDGFVCEDWQPGDPSVAQQVLGEGWQVACFPGKPDKCLAVRTAWGTFEGCETDRCDEVLQGREVDGCGTGSRMGAGLVQTDEGALPVVGLHGTSGVSADDQACRVRQIEAIFDGDDPLIGDVGIVLGDLNTDPGRQADADPSAAKWLEVTDGSPWRFATSIDPDDPPTYLAVPVVSIDHILTAALGPSDCIAVGLDDGPVTFPELALWDHRPMACTVRRPFPLRPHDD